MRIDEIIAASDGPVFSFEFFPPKTDAASGELFANIAQLQVLQPSFVSVTYGAGGSTRERTHATVKRIIAERFGVEFHVRYVGKLLQKLGFSYISARPRHPAQDERIVEAFKKTYGPPRSQGGCAEIGG